LGDGGQDFVAQRGGLAREIEHGDGLGGGGRHGLRRHELW
jgi:hypothetical protein